MSTRRFKLTKRQIKLLCTIIAVVALWKFLSSDQAINAVVALIFGGIVPGTGIVLSPGTLLASEGVVVGLSLLVTTWKLSAAYTRHQERRRVHPSTAQAKTEHVPAVKPDPSQIQPVTTDTEVTPMAPSANAEPLPATPPEPIFIYPAKPLRAHRIRTSRSYQPRPLPTIPSFTIPTLRQPHIPLNVWHLSLPRTLWPKLSIIVRLPIFLCIAFWQGLAWLTLSTYALVLSIWQQTLHAVQYTAQAAIHLSIRSWRTAHLTATRTWIWAAPYIWRYDKWVELQTRRFGNWTAKRTRRLIHKHDNICFILTTVKEAIGLIPAERPKARRRSRKTLPL